jgi:5-formyltetrahydrofolate cyclo-ligase
MESWDDIREWRRSVRSQLQLKRSVLPRGEKESVRTTVCNLMREHFPELRFACLGFYWPFQREIDVRHLVRNFLALGAEAALPVVVETRRPLEFWSWRPRMKLRREVWNIPVPGDRSPVQPTVLLVPLLGLDAAGYRLGHGGVTTIARWQTVAQKPPTIGIGYELGRLQTIYPQPHDIPMDAVVTESGVVRFRHRDGLCPIRSSK